MLMNTWRIPFVILARGASGVGRPVGSGGSHIGLSIEGGFKSSAHHDIERLKGRP